MKIQALPIFLLLIGSTVPAFSADSIVRFNEVMYHPDTGQSEWVELFNGLSYEMDLSNWEIDGGINYTFPEGTLIPPDGYLLVARTPSAFTNALGPFSEQLSNGGETIRLKNNSGRLMDRLNYGDSGDWPAGPDGSGSTLAKIDPLTVSDEPAHWRTSEQTGGTPGVVNFPGAGGPIVTRVVDLDRVWRFEDSNTDLGTMWKDSGFNDAAWPTGLALFAASSNAVGVTLTVTNNLVQRHRAEDITGLNDGDIVPTWPDTALDDGTAQNTTSAGDPRFILNGVNGKPVVRLDGNTDELRASLNPGIGAQSGYAFFIALKANGVPDNGTVGNGGGDYMFDRDILVTGNPLVSLKAQGGAYGYQTRYQNGSGLGGPVST
ncbi:MAG: lamin tail domain-containing protein, partial [Verrucomicrobiota bacterium]